MQRLLTRLCYLAVIVLVLCYLNKKRLPNYTEIDPSLLKAPVQRTLQAPEFSIEYKGHSYRVQPKASYDLRGLIVSQNNPRGLADIYHDSKSIDTKDFCVIWGHNVRSNEFHQVKFWSNAWTCWCQWQDAGLRFWMDELSNNHLITDSDAIRHKIARAGIGDQVHIKGMLVGYKESGTNQGWRNSSLNRTDTGNGACEVIFVQELTIISSTTRIWREGFRIAIISLSSLLLFKAVLFWFFGTNQVLNR